MVDIQKLLSVVATDLMRGRREQVSTAALGQKVTIPHTSCYRSYVATLVVMIIGPSVDRNEGTL